MRLLTEEELRVARGRGHHDYCVAVKKDPNNQELLGQEFISRAIADAEHKATLKAVGKAINDYAHNQISFEKLAELLEINFYELDAAFRKRDGILGEAKLPDNPFKHLYENQAPNNIEIMLKVEKIKAYAQAQQDMVDAGWWPVKEIKKEE